MNFRTTLFQALRIADIVSCNGEAVVAKMLGAPDGLLQPYVDLAGGRTIYLQDCDIQVDAEGLAYATSRDGREPIVWRFQVMKPLGASDVAVIEPPRQNIREVMGRLQQLKR